MQLQNSLNGLRVLYGAGDVAVSAKGKLHALHCRGVRHPGFHTGHIQTHADPQRQDHRRHKHGALPAAAQHPEGLAQQHLRAEEAHKAQCRHAHQRQRQRRRLDASFEKLAPDQVVEPLSHRQRRADAQAEPEHMPRPGHRHHVVRRFTAAHAVNCQRRTGQNQARQNVDAQRPKPRDGMIHITPQLLVPGARGLQPGHQLIGRRQPADPCGGAAAVIPVEEDASQHLHCLAQRHHDHIQRRVKYRHCQDLSGKHGAEHREGVEEQHLPRRADKPQADVAPLQHTGGALDGGGQKARHRKSAQKHDAAGQIVGEKQSLPPDGEAVHHAHAAGRAEIGKERHGEKAAKGQSHPQSHLRAHAQQIGDRRIHQLDGGVVPGGDPEKGQKLVQRHRHQPYRQVCAPQRPKPAQVLAQQRSVKARCL